MFTGIVENTGTIAEARAVPGGRRLALRDVPWAAECELGASVAVSGVCLTVTDRGTNNLSFDVIAETLRQSTLGDKNPGDMVNLERSLRVGDRLDGHFVQGHVDGTAAVREIVSSPKEWVVWLQPQKELMPYVISKGSIAIDGVSLTIAEVRGNSFSVALIPTTLERTTFSEFRTGDRVNIESDVVTRTVVHTLARVSGDGLTIEKLRQAGFA